MTIKITPKNPHWLFWIKLSYPVIALVLFLLIIFPNKFIDNPETNKPEEYSPTMPPRVKLMCINTISIVMFFMSINEFNFYQVMEPIGVDGSKIPPDCSIAQYCGIVFMLFVAVTFLVFYNFIIIRFDMILTKGAVKAEDIVLPASVTAPAITRSGGSSSSVSTSSIARVFNEYNYTTKNYGLFMTNNFANPFEFYLCGLLCVASITIYLGFLISRYFASGDKPMRFCLHPRDVSRYIDPYENPEPVAQ